MKRIIYSTLIVITVLFAFSVCVCANDDVDKCFNSQYGNIYTKFAIDGENNLSKNLFFEENLITEYVNDFCVNQEIVYYCSNDNIYSYNLESNITNIVYYNIQFRNMVVYDKYLYGVDEREGLSQLCIIDISNNEIIKTNYINVNAFAIDNNKLNVEMKINKSKLNEFETSTFEVSAYGAIADSEEINNSQDGLHNLIKNADSEISLFSITDTNTPVLMGTVTLSSIQQAKFVMDTLNVTQGGHNSNANYKAFDFGGDVAGTTAETVRAPFDGTVKYKETEWNTVWVQSNSIVQYANGTTGYMTVLFMHDNDISNVYVGMPLKQGQAFYNEGGKGPNGTTQYATHLHLECMSGQVGSKGWSARGNIYPNDALYIDNAIAIKNKGGYTWRNAVHVHSYWIENEATHPHREYKRCSCGHTEYTGKTGSYSTCSLCTTPGKPVLKMQDLYSSMDNITFRWESTNNTTHYNLYIRRLDKDGTFKGFENIFYAESGISRNLEPGYYYVLLESKNSNYKNATGTDWLSTFSDYYYFNVIDIENIKLGEGKKYILLDEPMSWHAAKKYCELLGGHLATIESEEENKEIYKLLQDGTMKYYWIGGTDAEEDEMWKWVNGTQFWQGGASGNTVNNKYVNWGNGEPNGGKNDGESNYACIYKSTGMWDDTSFNHTQIGVVCEFEEITPVIENGRYMIFDEKLPWYVAKKYCETLGGHLVTIESAEENEIIYDLIQGGESKYYWLGATDIQEDKKWKWINGNQFWQGDAKGYSVNNKYVNWGNNEPNGMGEESTCVCIYKSTGMWDDTSYNHTQIGFICEMEDAYTKSTVTKSGAKLMIDTKVHNIVGPYDLLIVGYKDNKFVTIKRATHHEQNSPYTLDGDIDKIKVMVWSDLATLKPLCEVEEIISDKFIIE